MAENSAIEWTRHTFNCWRGCTKVSAGCANCYAETLSKRNPGTLGVWGPSGTRVVASEAMWREPYKWNRIALENYARWNFAVRSCRSEYDSVDPYERPRVFCASLADVFEDWRGNMVDSQGRPLFVTKDGGWTNAEDDVPAITMSDVRARLFELIDATPSLDWLLLTKRPENVLRFWPASPMSKLAAALTKRRESDAFQFRSNVWLGTTVENRAALPRIDILRSIPAAVRFLSCEPLLEDLGTLDLTGIHWVIVGGESGGIDNVRPFNVARARSIIEQCRTAGVACFMKQLGSAPEGLMKNGLLRVRNKKGGDIEEWPVDLQVREFPTPTVWSR